jgi:hypothetical protein
MSVRDVNASFLLCGAGLPGGMSNRFMKFTHKYIKISQCVFKTLQVCTKQVYTKK